MSDDLASGLAATSGEPTADTTPATQDSVLDAAFAESSEPTASSEPSASADPVEQPVAATQQPQEQAKPETTGVNKGEPPREKWDQILANARTKARDEALAEHRDHLEVVAELKRDFPGTLARLLEEAAGNPQFSETITAKAAALLNARKQAAKADEEPQPDAVMRYEDGTTEPTFSPAQQRKWQEWNSRRTERKLTEQFKPLQDLQQRFEQHQQVQQLAKEAATVAEERGALWKTMPHFEDHKDAILKRQQTMYDEAQQAARRDGRRFDPVNAPWEALQRAYAEVVSTQALPKLQSQQTDNLVANAARKRAGSSDPAAGLPAQPRRPRTEDEALEQVFGTA